VSRGGRREQRYPVRLPILLRIGHEEVEEQTEDVSHSGVFVSTLKLPTGSAPPPPEPGATRGARPIRPGQLVHISLVLPPAGDTFSVPAMLVRKSKARFTGVALSFYGVGRHQQEIWDRFIAHLRSMPAIAGRATRLAVGSPFEPVVVRNDAHQAVLRVEVRTVDDLLQIYERDVPRGSLFLLTDADFDAGTPIGLQLLHPNSGDIFEVSGVVTRRVLEYGIAGLSVDFFALNAERKQRMYDFIYDGIADLFDEDSFDET
jgi:hypothetical protein